MLVPAMQSIGTCILLDARTGNIGDGKIFITSVDEAYTIRTGQRGL